MNSSEYLFHLAEDSGSGGGGGGVPVVPLRVDGLHFKRPDGTIWKYRCVTAFSALDDWIKGDRSKLERYADWTLSLGLNCWRVFGAWNNVGLKPNDAYYPKQYEFFEWLKGRGLYCHFVMLCDQVPGSAVHMTPDRQVNQMQRSITNAAELGNVILECFNEFEKNDGDGLCGLLQHEEFLKVPATRSWWNENESYLTAGSLLDFTTGHTDRGREWARTFIQTLDVSQRGYGLPDGSSVPATRKPHILGEPRRVAEGTTPRQHADYHAGALLYGPGGCLHGGFKSLDGRHESDLQFCVVPDGLSRDCCDAVGAVQRSDVWPLNTPEGHYTRGGVDNFNNDSLAHAVGTPPILHRDRYFGGSSQLPAYEEPEGAARSFFVELGGKWYGLAVDPGPAWQLKIRDGFRLVAQGGYDGNMLVLERV